jgi:hypothetical protein
MKRFIGACFALAVAMSACNNTVATSDHDLSSKKETNNDNKNIKEVEKGSNEGNQTQVLNDISIEAEGGVEVYRAFLSYENGNLVPTGNSTSPGKPVYLNLNITKGWKEEMGEVSIGASEKISTDNGTIVLDEPDLFKNYTSISADDAKFIKLKAVVNSMSGPIKYFVVDYKVWDKNGDGVIKGSYRFYVE